MVAFRTLISDVCNVLDLAQDVKAYHLQVPADFGYKAGQFVTVEVVISQPDGSSKSIKRSYSIASSPHTSPTTIELCIKETPGGQFTPWFLRNIKIGDQVTIQGPFGKFTLYETDKPNTIYLISAGSGVAPVMGLLRDCIATKRAVNIGWISSNKTPADIIYRTEVEQIAKDYPTVSTFFTITRPESQNWTGHIGRLDRTILDTFCNDKSTSIFFICGPPPFVDEVVKDLGELGINPDLIRKEKYD